MVTEAKVLQFLNDAGARRLAKHLTPEEAIRWRALVRPKPLQRIEDVLDLMGEMYPEIEDQAVIEWMAKEFVGSVWDSEESRATKMKRAANKAANRAKYQLYPLWRRYELANANGKTRWQFTETLRPEGLLDMIVQHLHGTQSRPAAMAVQLQTEGEDRDRAIRQMWGQGYAISGERLAVDMQGPGWAIVNKCFPLAAHAAGYLHGLVAGLLPSSEVKDAAVTFTAIKTADGKDAGTDGSGLYHPEAPNMKAFVQRYGLVAMQIRGLNPTTGTFFKGVLFPSETALDENGNPAVLVDWNMIKGANKTAAMKFRANGVTMTRPGFYWGALQTWSKKSYLSGGFELLELVRHNPLTEAAVKRLVDQGMTRMMARGMAGLAADVAKKDEVLSLIMQLLAVGEENGMSVHPMQVPRIKSAVEDRMGTLLYRLGVSAGFRAPSYVVRMDSAVPRGCVVLPGYDVGEVVGGFRYPMIAAQNAMTFKVIAPLPHHLVNGQLTKNVAACNPDDVKFGAIGDDDGDFMGFTDDPNIIAMFENRYDARWYAIEPKGIPVLGTDGKELQFNSPEGLAFVARDQRGPVGMLTMWRSGLLAVGDFNGALALSVLIQEAIDKAKRLPEWTDWRLAADPKNWTQRADGMWVCDCKLARDEYQNGTLPIKAVREWYRARLVAAGSFYIDDEGKPQGKSPLWWTQVGDRKKRVSVGSYVIPEENKFENLVHVSMRHVLRNWERMLAEMNRQLVMKITIDEQLLLPVLMTKMGIAHTPPGPFDWEELKRLRNKWGLSSYNSAVNPDSRQEVDPDVDFGSDEEDEKHRAAHLVTALTKLTDTMRQVWNLDEAMKLWAWETSGAVVPGAKGREAPNPMNAWRVMCWNGSPMMRLLGIEGEEECTFLTGDLIQQVITSCLRHPQPTTRLWEIIANSRLHQTKVFDETGDPVFMADCPHCVQRLTDGVVMAIRDRAAKPRTDVLIAMHGRMKD